MARLLRYPRVERCRGFEWDLCPSCSASFALVDLRRLGPSKVNDRLTLNADVWPQERTHNRIRSHPVSKVCRIWSIESDRAK